MALSKEQVKELKEQLIEQTKNLPLDQRKQAEEHIQNMSPQSIELMLKQQSSSEKGIFRMIADKEIESVILDENDESLCVLDINPVSEGHAIVIPKTLCSSPQKLPQKAFALAQKISLLIKENLKASSIDIQTETKFGEAIIHIIPSYSSPISLNSPRKKSSIENLKALSKKIKTEEKPKLLKIKKLTHQLELVKKSRKIP